MPIASLGVNHRTWTLAMRERLVPSPAQQRAMLARVRDGALRAQGVTELVVLSTCNRVEIYCGAETADRRFRSAPPALLDLLLGTSGLSSDVVRPHVASHVGIDAVRHLARVAAGLESMVVGESEVSGQAKAAFRLAVDVGAAGPVLDAAFRTALRAARRARAETGISRAPGSVSSVAVHLAESLVPRFSEQCVLILGTGQAARLTGDILRSKGVARLMVVSRTPARARELAARWNAEPLAWHDLGAGLHRADIVFCSTGAGRVEQEVQKVQKVQRGPVITPDLIPAAIDGAGGRAGRLLYLIDMAVPRDVAPDVGAFPHVHVFDLDHLQTVVADNRAARREEMPRVAAILDEEIAEFVKWRRGARLRPLLSALWARGESIRDREVARLLEELDTLAPEHVAVIQRFARSLVNKLLDEPVRTLRQETDPARSEALEHAFRRLFGLDPAVLNPGRATRVAELFETPALQRPPADTKIVQL